MTKCLWIDSNGDQPQTGFKVHWPEFTPTASGTAPKDEDFYCNNPATLEFYTTPDPNSITYWVPNNPKIKRSALAHVSLSRPKRSLQYGRRNSHHQGFRNETHTNRHANRLVVSNSASQTSSELCESQSSVGPDFINLAGSC